MTSGAEDAALDTATRWGRIDDDGTVYVRTRAGERVVGSWQAGDAEAGLRHFGRRFDDLVTEVELLEQRLAAGSGEPRATVRQARGLQGRLGEANVIGDLDGLDRRLSRLIEAAGAREEQRAAERSAARAAAVAGKEALVAEAEALASRDGAWKATGDRFKAIVDEWRQIRGVDRRTDEALWKRFRAARDEFTRRRGAHFAALDEQRGAAAAKKEQLAVEAEKLADSTDWGPTAGRFKALMRQWREAGRAQKGADETLWERFRTAQDTFFSRRADALRARDEGLKANQRAKEALIAEAAALDPDRNVKRAQADLRGIQQRYEEAGPVPRDAMRDLDARMRAAEQRIRDVADVERRRAEASANPLLGQLRDAVDKAQAAAEKARASGDAARIAQAEEALAARRGWLAEAERVARR